MFCYCEKCGQKYMEERKKCPVCGKKLAEVLTEEERKLQEEIAAFIAINTMFSGML